MTSAEGPADEELAQRAAEGDDRAFGELVRRHQAGLYRLLRRYTGEADEAYEAAHEAFIAAWAALPGYDAARPFLAWLRTIAINKARDRGRRAAFRRLLFGRDGLATRGGLSAPDPAPPADRVMIEDESLAALDRAVAGLPPALKEPLILTAFEGLSQREAAELLGVTAKAIETRCRRARSILARALDPGVRPAR
ncbi:MAG: RNA polymerase sigma factor [Caulobacteraceae bacterium]